MITICNNHSHSIDSADAFGALPASRDTRMIFESYFNNGLGITEAINYHLSKVELEMDETDLAKGSLNPKYRTVRYWYDSWRKLHLGSRDSIGALEVYII